jgi:uncharacterized protein involved in type VI secretion and phage assembly
MPNAHDDVTLRLLDQVESRFYGKYRGTVTDNGDPLSVGRVRARVPEVLHDVESGWCTPCVPYAGKDKGWFVIPEAGDGVWVEFEGGDPSRPIWTGSWWGSGEIPKDPNGSGATTQTKVLKSANGLILDLDDGAQTIYVSDSSGSNLLSIAVNEGQVVVQATTSVTVEAPMINLGQNAGHPVAFGDMLLQYLTQLTTLLQAHVHPTIFPTTGPPAAPFIPPDPSLFSTAVMAK